MHKDQKSVFSDLYILFTYHLKSLFIVTV